MRELPACTRVASTITRPPSWSVMWPVSIFAPSAMPTRSAPSSIALVLICAAVSGRLKMFKLFPFEFLQLPRDDALVALLADPADVPLGQSRQVVALLARLLEALRLRHLLRRLLGDLLLDVGEVRVVVVADRAHRQAARAVAERADHAQQALPEAEQVSRAKCLLLLFRRKIQESAHEIRNRHEAEFLRLGGAGGLVEPPLAHGVGRAGMQAAAAGLADANLLLHALVRFQLELGEDAGEVEARAELRRQDVHFEAEGAEAGLHAEMARGELAVARALHVPDGFLRGEGEGRMAVALELLRELERDAVHAPQHQHVEVLHRHVGLAAERADRDALHDHDHALDVGRD